MSLIACPDCNKEVSTNAPNCIHCGAPLKPMGGPTTAATLQPSSNRRGGGGWFGKLLLWAVVAIAGFLVLGTLLDTPERRYAREVKAKEECSRALTSSIGTSTSSYADKAAYDARVRDACAGFEINGRDLGQQGR